MIIYIVGATSEDNALELAGQDDSSDCLDLQEAITRAQDRCEEQEDRVFKIEVTKIYDGRML